MPQIYFSQFLRNAGNDNMAVDGSVTPVTFELDISAAEAVFITKLHFYGESPGVVKDYLELGTIPQITNGLQLQVQSQGVPFMSALIHNNRDLLRFFNKDSDLRLREIGTDNSYRGTREITPSSIVLSSRTNDYLRVVVQDDLTDLTYMSLQAEGSAN